MATVWEGAQPAPDADFPEKQAARCRSLCQTPELAADVSVLPHTRLKAGLGELTMKTTQTSASRWPDAILIGLPALTLAVLIGALWWASRPDPLVRLGSTMASEDLGILAWSVAPVLALLGLAIPVVAKRPTTWRRLLVVDAVFLLLTLLGLRDSVLDPNGSSTASLGLLVLPIPQWLLVVVGLVALIGQDPDGRRRRPITH